MNKDVQYLGGENFDLRTVLLRGRRLPLAGRVECFEAFLHGLMDRGELTTMREIVSAADRIVTVALPGGSGERQMLMFGSNNYLGLANHPRVVEAVRAAVARYGAGIGGPPLLNGYTRLHRELEERLAALKGAGDAMIFPSGYGANVGLVTGLVNPDDVVFYDAYSHASLCDGLKMAGAESHSFRHNDIADLERMLARHAPAPGRDVYIAAEGVYSMDGDTAPVDRLVAISGTHGARLLLDDAHGTGVMGPTGRGTAEAYGMEGMVDVTMGTFSKAFAVTGGFVAAEKGVIDYLRYFARSYMFSASLPPAVIAAVLAGLDVMEHEPDLRAGLHANVAYLVSGLRGLGFDIDSRTGVLPLIVPAGMNIRRAARRFDELGIFVNAVEFPAVPVSQQRFRISVMATHTRNDLDRLLEAVAAVWSDSTLRVTQ